MRGHADEFGSSEAADADRAGVVRPHNVAAGLLGLQRTAGNRAVSAALTEQAAHGPPILQRQQVAPKAQVKLPGKAGDFQAFIDAGGPYALFMYALNDDVIGHTWIGVRRGDGKVKTAGFWPNSLFSGIVGPGQLMTPDGHEGGQSGAYEEPVPDINQIYRLLAVIQSWDGAIYSLLFKNCAHFVVDAWKTVTGKDVFPGKNADLMVDMWNPLMIGMAIDERNKRKKEMDKARGDQQAGDADTRTAGEPQGGTMAAPPGGDDADLVTA